jgi:hypothetical protein
MGNWSSALDSAHQVLAIDKKFVKAILVKAESLYNTCSFEHALIYYHRGQVRKRLGMKITKIQSITFAEGFSFSLFNTVPTKVCA